MEIDGISVNYIDIGAGDETILFLHGWQAPIDVYQSIYDRLKDKYRIVALDTPGCGKTPEPPVGWKVDNYVDFVLKFCKELGLTKVILMGHSFGVRLMVKLMALHGDKLSCNKAVICDGAGIVPKRSLNYYFKVYSYKFAKKVVANKLGNYFFGPLFEERNRTAGSADYAAASPVMRHTLSLVVNEDLKHLMPKVQADILLIWGEKDDATPLSDGQTMEKLMPKAALAVVTGAGHYPFLDSPAVFGKILDAFL